MASGRAPKRYDAVYAELEAVPPHRVAEIIDGEVVTSPRPGAPHTRAASRLGMKLGGPFDLGEGGPGGWVILDEPELHLGSPVDVVVPDLAAWRRERLPQMPDTAAFELAPDWVCEVLSASTAALDRTAKMRIYAREHVGHVWLIEPIAQTLEVFRNVGPGWELLQSHRGTEAVRAAPFDAVEIDLGVLWAR
jgi:Uma2 family endonuclease